MTLAIMTANGWVDLLGPMKPAPSMTTPADLATSARIKADYDELFLENDGTDMREVMRATGLDFTEQRRLRTNA